MKRMAFKKQKRWWNAYILFYERIKHSEINPTSTTTITTTAASTTSNRTTATVDVDHDETTPNENKNIVNMPSYILKSVHKKNIKFLHHRHHFSPEYFQFVKKLVQTNISLCQNDVPLVSIILYLSLFKSLWITMLCVFYYLEWCWWRAMFGECETSVQVSLQRWF